MSKKIRISIVAAMLLTLLASAVQAQTRSIRGTVRLDTNGDGSCADGDPVEGITVNFKNEDGSQDLYLQSGADGTYGLVAVNFNNWTVTLQPNADWVLTSEASLPAGVWPETPVVTDIDFCVRSADASGSSDGGNTVLPQSGAATAPALEIALWSTLLVGAGLITTGAGLEWRRRQNSS